MRLWKKQISRPSADIHSTDGNKPKRGKQSIFKILASIFRSSAAHPSGAIVWQCGLSWTQLTLSKNQGTVKEVVGGWSCGGALF